MQREREAEQLPHSQENVQNLVLSNPKFLNAVQRTAIAATNQRVHRASGALVCTHI